MQVASKTGCGQRKLIATYHWECRVLLMKWGCGALCRSLKTGVWSWEGETLDNLDCYYLPLMAHGVLVKKKGKQKSSSNIIH